MNVLVDLSQELSMRLVRFSLAVVLIGIGGLKFADPTPVVGLLAASFSFLAANGFVYLLGAVEVTAGALLLSGLALPWVGSS
jgi:reactive chlorine resistance protein C